MTNRELLNKYNTVVAKCKDLQEQLNVKNEQWEQQEKQFEITLKAAKKLCEMILSKDRDEMNLGKESTSWNSISPNQLIERAVDSYKAYTKSRAAALTQLLDLAEERQAQIEGLQDEIEFLKNNSDSTVSYEEHVAEKKQEEAIDKLDPETKYAAKEGGIDVMVEDADGNDSSLTALLESNAIAPMEDSIPCNVSTSKTAALRKKRKEQEITRKYQADMSTAGILPKLSEMQKDFIDIIGTQGLSVASEITDALLKIDKYSDGSKSLKTIKNNAASALTELQSMSVIQREKIGLPINPKTFQVIMFTELGLKVYEALMGKKAVTSEATNIISEHDNLTHGYAIKALYTNLLQTGMYSDVDMHCRRHPIQTDPKNPNIKYIADVYAVYAKNGAKCYFEYEHGKTAREDMIAKCSKMRRVTHNLYFLVNDKKSAEKLTGDIIKWKESIQKKNIKAKVYISTMDFFQRQNFDIMGPWQIVFGDKDLTPSITEQ